MEQKRGLLVLGVLLLLFPLVRGATVGGAIYDLSLEPLKDVVVTINSTPKQTYVAKEGIYAFEVSEGSYLIEAHHPSDEGELVAKEPVLVTEDRRFIIDLILFPVVDGDAGLDNVSLDSLIIRRSIPHFQWLLLIFAVLITFLLLIFYFYRRDDVKGSVDDEELGKILQFIKDHGGRVSQKDLRTEFPLSEAKISLMVTELAHDGRLKKIKQGKGNILILNR
ncbi:MAG: hypothetical protein GXP63_05350 [DPANN group archaeon]|nr:hypothetical protein [DPANN group archaeon]